MSKGQDRTISRRPDSTWENKRNDADKRRIAKTVDSTTTKYFLDGSNVVADYDGSDTLVATYVTPGLASLLCASVPLW